MESAVKRFVTTSTMLEWQYFQIIGELTEIQRHMSDPTCPCRLSEDLGENCLCKHTLGLSVLASETAAMDSEHTNLLMNLSIEAKEQHEKMRGFLCDKNDEPDLTQWARNWRKAYEKIYYGMCQAKKKSKLKDIEHLFDKIFFDDTYKGERWTYGLNYRPLGYTQVPDGWIVFSDRKHPGFKFGTVAYPRKLTQKEISDFQLTPVRSLHDIEHLFDPLVRITGKCVDQDCSFKVTHTDKIEMPAGSIKTLPQSVEDVLAALDKKEITASDLTFAYGTTGLFKYDLRYRIVDGDKLIVSHDVHTGEENPAFPQELQPRDRTRAASQLQIKNIATNMNNDLLLVDFRSTDRGAPIIYKDMIVESGNGRTMALLFAADQLPEKLDSYKDALRRIAPVYKLDPADVDKYRVPILVRERLTEVNNRKSFVDDCNARTGLAMSAIEQAKRDAEKITFTMMSSLELLEGESFDQALRAPRNNQFLVAFLNALPANDRASLVDARGVVNSEGVRRAIMATFVATFKGEVGLRLAQAQFEELDNDVKVALSGIAGSLGFLAQAENLALSGAREAELSIGEDLAIAVRKWGEIKRITDYTVDKYLAQMQMGTRELTPFQERLLKVLAENARSSKRIAGILVSYANLVIASPPPGQVSFMSGVRPVKADLFETAVRSVLQQAEAEKIERESRRAARQMATVSDSRPVIEGKIQTQTERMIPYPVFRGRQAIKKLDRWLWEQGNEEAEAKREDFMIRMFHGMNPEHLSPADRDTLNDYLFGETYPEFQREARLLDLFDPLRAPRMIPKEQMSFFPSTPTTTAPAAFTPVQPARPVFKLDPCQDRGVQWLKDKSAALLADDMGIGKTAQAIHWGADRRPALVVAPTALIYNWQREIAKMWRPDDTVTLIEGDVEVPKKLADWTIVSYGMLSRYIPTFRHAGFKSVIIDEAHKVKNMDTQRTKAVLSLVTAPRTLEDDPAFKIIPNRLAVTGTPIVNRPIELFPLLVFLGKKTIDDHHDFMERYTESKTVNGRRIYTGAKNLGELNKYIKEFMLRRMKEECLPDLPPKRHTPMFVPISNAREYMDAERNFLTWLRNKKGDEAAFRAASAEIIVKMNELRHLAAIGKVQAVADWLKPCEEGRNKVIIFSSFLDTIRNLSQIKGSSVVYSGETKAIDRQAMVDKFQKEPDLCFFMGTTPAAGVGITLTAADRVVFMDLPWTPGDKRQAEDRAHRRGQKRPVEIVDVLAKNTIDERMLKILMDKEFIISQAVDGKTKDQAMTTSVAKDLLDAFIHTPFLGDVPCYETEEPDPDVDEIEEAKLAQFAYTDEAPEPAITKEMMGIIPPEYEKFKVQLSLDRSPDWNIQDAPQITSPRDAQKLFRLMRKADREWLLIVLLDTQLHVIGFFEQAIGDSSSAIYSQQELARIVAKTAATNILVVHNHPTGSPNPSSADRTSYDNTLKSMHNMGVGVIDFMIVGADLDYSMKGGSTIPIPADQGIIPATVPYKPVFVMPAAPEPPEQPGEFEARREEARRRMERMQPSKEVSPESIIPPEAMPGREFASRLQPPRRFGTWQQAKLMEKLFSGERSETAIRRRLKEIAASMSMAYDIAINDGGASVRALEAESKELHARLDRIIKEKEAAETVSAGRQTATPPDYLFRIHSRTHGWAADTVARNPREALQKLGWNPDEVDNFRYSPGGGGGDWSKVQDIDNWTPRAPHINPNVIPQNVPKVTHSMRKGAFKIAGSAGDYFFSQAKLTNYDPTRVAVPHIFRRYGTMNNYEQTAYFKRERYEAMIAQVGLKNPLPPVESIPKPAPKPVIPSTAITPEAITPHQARLFDVIDKIAEKIENTNMTKDEIRNALTWRPLRELVAWAVGSKHPVQFFKVGMVEGTYQITCRDLTPTLMSHITLHTKGVPGIRRIATPYNEAVFEVVTPAEERPVLEFMPQEVKRQSRAPVGAQVALFQRPDIHVGDIVSFAYNAAGQRTAGRVRNIAADEATIVDDEGYVYHRNIRELTKIKPGRGIETQSKLLEGGHVYARIN